MPEMKISRDKIIKLQIVSLKKIDININEFYEYECKKHSSFTEYIIYVSDGIWYNSMFLHSKYTKDVENGSIIPTMDIFIKDFKTLSRLPKTENLPKCANDVVYPIYGTRNILLCDISIGKEPKCGFIGKPYDVKILENGLDIFKIMEPEFNFISYLNNEQIKKVDLKIDIYYKLVNLKLKHDLDDLEDEFAKAFRKTKKTNPGECIKEEKINIDMKERYNLIAENIMKICNNRDLESRNKCRNMFLEIINHIKCCIRELKVIESENIFKQLDTTISPTDEYFI